MKCLSSMKLVIATTLALAYSSISYAQEQQKSKPICGQDFSHANKTQFVSCFYLGAGLGYSQLEPDTKKSAWEIDENNDISFALYGGYQFTQTWFTELVTADLGKTSLKYSNPLSPRTEFIQTQVVAVYAGYNLPLHFIPDTQFYLKAGLSYIMHESSDKSVRLDSSSNLVAPALAGGVQWRFSDNWTLRGEFNSFSNRTKMADISIAYWFGNNLYRPIEIVRPVVVEEAVADLTTANLTTEPTVEELEARNIRALENDQLPAIYVNVDSTVLNQSALNELEALVTALNAYPDVHIQIQGHTDSTGSRAYNQKLSERRAKRVYQHLVNKGIDKIRLKIIGFGMDKPIADNKTEEGRSQNRRIDFIIETMD